ncbi:hypothetical protein BC938DRAFT_479673 [Jimgerdemannia flammicorona]|uniref:Armadillo-like helical domain-containing protein n=1 Tax=Jimgerdemannia flammicorona TaxID=994334 RepID=A0A433QXZ3_9FUNG|nr:hypothetical protein BC938DRAFT_479673 [Jimgerdemannia flammicorona]
MINQHLNSPSPEASILLPFYDLVNTNKIFVNTLVRSLTITTADPTPPQPTSPTTIAPSTTSIPPPAGFDEDHSSLAAFLSLASYLFQHNNRAAPRPTAYVKLAMLVLVLLCENQAACEVFCDESVVGRSEYGAGSWNCTDGVFTKQPRPAACVILDLAISFINHNMRKKLDIDLYRELCQMELMHICSSSHLTTGGASPSSTGLSAIKRNHEYGLVMYHWSELWHSLIGLTRFVIAHSEGLKSRPEFDELVELLVGTPKLGPTGRPQRAPSTLVDMTNIRMIYTHFNPKIEEWQQQHHVQALTPANVLTIINKHYDTLELVTLDKLELSTWYSEIPAETSFFRQLLRTIVIDFAMR